jgi:ATP-dependent protease ClpP protease subunit
MTIFPIEISGLIGSPESDSDTQKYFSLSDMLLAINKAMSFDAIELVIDSNGGYVDIADKMIEVLKATKKPIFSRNSGNVCSAASKLFTLPAKENRTFDATKGQFLIHNPWVGVEGDSTQLAQMSDELNRVENEYAKWYTAATGSDLNVIKGFMSQNIPLTVEQIESLGFATCKKIEIKAFAKLKLETSMENKEVLEKLSGFEKMLTKIMAMFPGKMKAMMLADVDGKELEFPEINDITELKAGVKVTAGGSPASDEYTMPDGSVLVCEAGVVKEIKAPAGDEMAALKKEIEALKAENESLKAEKTASDEVSAKAITELSNISAEYKKIKALFSDGNPKNGTPPSSGEKKCISRYELEKMLN